MSMRWAVESRENGHMVRISGSITEEADLHALVALGQGKDLRLDLAGVDEINSCGVREWIRFVRRVSETASDLELVRCSPAIVRQLNMVSNFRGSGRVTSVMLPYYCDACGAEQERYLELGGADAPPEIQETVVCERCGEQAEFDDLPDSYMGFIGLLPAGRVGR